MSPLNPAAWLRSTARRSAGWLPAGWLSAASLSSRRRRVVAAAAGLVILLALALGVAPGLFGGSPMVHATAHFARTIGVYPGSDVRVLGVKIGTITDVTPEGPTVRVRFAYDARHPVPANAVAVIVAPSLVSDRYLQLAPVYTGGPALADGADIPLSRTGSPVELDEVYSALNDLSVALGPSGANRHGALSRLVDVGAANLAGNGAALGRSLADLSRATQTLANGRQDLVGVIRGLAVFTHALAANDRQVRQFNSLLAEVTGELAGERNDLSAALSNLATALGQVATFVRDNRAALHSDVSDLAQLSGVLARQRAALAEVLDEAPLALGNLGNAYNASSGTLDTRNQLGSLANPAILCGLLDALGRLPALDPAKRQLCQALAGLPGGLPTIPGAQGPLGGHPLPGPPLPSVPVPSIPRPTVPVPPAPVPTPSPTLPVPSITIGGR